jgi:predicted metal-binding membrane protein
VATTTLESLLKRDRLLVAAVLFVLTAVCWAYTVHMAREMERMCTEMGMHMDMDTHMDMGMEMMMMPQMQQWGLTELSMLFVMWVVMMVAMMTPTAAPMILLFASVQRKRREQERPFVRTGVFVTGYLLAWTAFSAVATAAQWGLHEAAVLSPMMVSTSSVFGGAVLVAAGVFQWMPWKNTCLRHCRSPLSFITAEWREGAAGALSMGLKHGAFCTGCCWALMALLFVGGVMNLLWIAGLTIFVLLEKVVPAGEALGRAAGVLLAAAGLWVATQGG